MSNSTLSTNDTPPAGRLKVGKRRKATREEAKPVAPAAQPQQLDKQDLLRRLLVGGLVLAAGIWAYWPTIVEMVTAWEREPDYSHGYLVIPVALFFLWWRRDRFPVLSSSAWLLGASLLGTSVVIRLFAGAFFFEAIDGWSMLLWIAGCVAILFGTPVLRWSAPAIAFLFFMIPLPFRLEGMLSLPLQRIATKISCWTLQLIGQPAISEGNTIVLGEHHLEIAQACSGLRLFVSIAALAFAYLVLVQRTWWEKLILVVSVVPIAIVANSARIVATGLLYQFVSSDAAKHFSHDFAGWAMIPLAAALFWAVLWYLGKLFREQEQLSVGALVRRIEV